MRGKSKILIFQIFTLLALLSTSCVSNRSSILRGERGSWVVEIPKSKEEHTKNTSCSSVGLKPLKSHTLAEKETVLIQVSPIDSEEEEQAASNQTSQGENLLLKKFTLKRPISPIVFPKIGDKYKAISRNTLIDNDSIESTKKSLFKQLFAFKRIPSKSGDGRYKWFSWGMLLMSAVSILAAGLSGGTGFYDIWLLFSLIGTIIFIANVDEAPVIPSTLSLTSLIMHYSFSLAYLEEITGTISEIWVVVVSIMLVTLLFVAIMES